MKRYKELSSLWKPFSERNISMCAAGACFYLFLSAIPAAILFLSSIATFPSLYGILDRLFKDVFPNAFYPILNALLEYAAGTSFSVVSLSIFTLMWSASKGIMSIMDGLNFALRFPKASNYFVKRALSILYFLMLSLSILLVMFCLVFADYFIVSIRKNLKTVSILLLSLIRFRGVAAFVILSIIFSLLLRLLPNGRLPIKSCITGGLLSALAWVTLSWLFSIYVRYFSNISHIGDGLGLVILSAIWLKLCISIILYCAIFVKLRADNHYKPIAIIKRALRKNESE